MLQAIIDRLAWLQPSTVWDLRWHWPWALALLVAAPWVGAPARRDGSVPDAGSSRHEAANEMQTRALRLPPALAAALDRHGGRAVRRGRTDRWWYALAWTLLILALAQPHRPGALAAAPVSGRALALVLDLSGSMERSDFVLDGAPSDRLSVVKRLAGDFLERRKGDRIGLVLFGKQAFIASPLTFDLVSLGDVLASAGIGMAGRSTAIGDALGLALSMLKDDQAAGKAVVLLSDGTNNAGSVEPEDAAGFAATLGVRVHTIAMGSEAPAADASRAVASTRQDRASGPTARGRGYATAASADLDEATLQAVAERSGGRFFRARSSDELAAVYRDIDALESSAVAAPPARLTEELRSLPLMALLLLILAWRVVVVRRS